MPIFEYQCTRCKTRFERIIFAESDTVRCPNCDSPDLEKLFSTFAVAGSPFKALAGESGPCGVCGAPQRGMCREN